MNNLEEHRDTEKCLTLNADEMREYFMQMNNGIAFLSLMVLHDLTHAPKSFLLISIFKFL